MTTIKKRLGELLVDAGVVSAKMIDDALRDKKEGQKLGDFLVEQGSVTEDILYEQLSTQLKIPFLNLSETAIDVSVLDKLPRDILVETVAFPIDLTGSLLSVAMSDPLDEHSLSILADNCEYDISPVLATKTEISDYISKYYSLDYSLRDLLGNTAVFSGDMNELQISDMFYTLLRNNSELQLVALDTNGILQLRSTNIPTLSSNDSKYIFNFIKKMVGYNQEDTEFRHTLYLNDTSVIQIKLVVNRKNNQEVIWLYSKILESSSEMLNTTNPTFLPIVETGVYIAYNSNYDHLDAYLDSLLTLRDHAKQRILVHSKDTVFTQRGLATLDIPLADIPLYADFSDIFVLDDIWEIDSVDTILALLKYRKKILLHVPFENPVDFDNYLKSRNLYELLIPFVSKSFNLHP